MTTCRAPRALRVGELTVHADGIRGGERCGLQPIEASVAQGAEHRAARGGAVDLRHRPRHEVRHGSLSVGPGHADHPEHARGVSVEARRRPPQAGGQVRHRNEPCSARVAPQLALPLVYRCRRACLTGRIDKAASVEAASRAREEDVSRSHLPTVASQAAHDALRVLSGPPRILQQGSKLARNVHGISCGAADNWRCDASSSPPRCTRRVTTVLSSGATASTRSAPCAIREKIGAATRPP